MDAIAALLRPEVVAIIGASADVESFKGRPLKYLRKHGYAGRIYPINPKYAELGGLPCFPSIEAAPEGIDVAFIGIPATAVPGVVAACARRGVRACIIFTGGFAEAGKAGRALQDQVAATARESGMAVLGPNCIGVVSGAARLALSASAALDVDQILPGRIGFISQSGSLTGSVLTRTQARGLGFRYLVSTGNEADLEVADFVAFMAADPDVRAIMIFLEGLRQPARFIEAAALARAAGKPIVVLKLGRSAIGARTAESHTGAMVGADDVYDAVFRKQAVLRVDGLEELFETASLLAKVPPPGGHRVGMVTTTGGGAALIADQLGTLGIEVPRLARQTEEALGRILPPPAAVGNPLDLTMSGATAYGRALETLAADPNLDFVLGVVGTSGLFFPELGVTPIAEYAKRASKPVAAYINPEAPASLRLLEENGVPSFRTPEGAARAIGRAVEYGRLLRRTPAATADPDCWVPPGAAERAAVLLRGRVGPLGEWDSRAILVEYGMRCAEARMARSAEEAAHAAEAIGFPVAVKALAPGLAHKTEAGGVRLNLATPEAVREAVEEVRAAARRRGVAAKAVLVQEMVAGGIEAALGMTRDPQFGPVLSVGLGGIWVELLDDFALGLPPLTAEEAGEMIAATRLSRLLAGFRGGPCRDAEALVDVLLRLSRMAQDLGDRIREIDINPLIVLESPEGVRAVDALVVAG
jgi:acyl-CoA synthetase (NDP forming)